jgi:hypothetical protein
MMGADSTARSGAENNYIGRVGRCPSPACAPPVPSRCRGGLVGGLVAELGETPSLRAVDEFRDLAGGDGVGILSHFSTMAGIAARRKETQGGFRLSHRRDTLRRKASQSS